MSDERKNQRDDRKSGMIVEDTTVTGGHDRETGADVVKPKRQDGRADESMDPTDPRERSRKPEKPD